ncbi:hypothetical protein P3T73_16110 [Kiritimatiellota bacterium B12222]|nr:hypothetical protein P3T73_16110 [Kiritimatiellota bacterium B12222]
MTALPSVYIYGMPIQAIDDSIYGGLFGNATRSVGLAFNLQKRGHEVFLEVDDAFENKITTVAAESQPIFVHERDRKQVLPKVDVLLMSCTNFDSFRMMFYRDPYLHHPKKVYACCFDYNQNTNFDKLKLGRSVITFNNEIQKKNWDRKQTGIDAHVIPYGVNEGQSIDDAIQDVAKEDVIWLGEIRRHDVLERLVKFAKINQDARLNIVARAIFDAGIEAGAYGSRENPYGEFTTRDGPEKFNEILREICDTDTPKNATFLGPMEGLNHEVLGAHSIGLDFSRFPGQDHDNTKIMDYLRSGVCVICDEGTPSYRFVKETGYGVIVSPDFSDDEIREAFQTCREMVSLENRKRVSQMMCDLHGWGTRAQQYSELISQVAQPSKKWWQIFK